jgi:hypothetical protein
VSGAAYGCGTPAAYRAGMHHTSSRLLRRLGLLAVLAVAPTAAAGCIAATDEPDETEGGETAYVDPEEADTQEQGVTGGSVQQAMESSCSTTSVKGLSQQIIAEAACMNPDAYVQVPQLDNVTFGSAVFRYLEKPARDKLVAALNANPGKTMTINSMLRTVAQQYLLYRWYQTGRCGIGLAAKPGNSNHETGLALDVSQYSSWKTILQNRGFHWLGSSDPVHFDYAGSGAVSYKGLDVKAFQRLWNRNHPEDLIAADGIWGPQTEARMKKAPAGGFEKGAQCAGALEDAEDPAGAPPSDGSAGADDAAAFEAPWAAEEALLAEPEIIDTALVEALELEHEGEICSDHAH